MKKKTLGKSGLTFVGKSIGATGPWKREIEFYDNVTPEGNWLFFALVKDSNPGPTQFQKPYLMQVQLKKISTRDAKTLVKHGVPAKLFHVKN
jgi:hypothetical protein